MRKLAGVPRRYEWGSVNHIQDILGIPPDGSPLAELWFGAHPAGPSAVLPAGDDHTLDELISANPGRVLGRRVAEEFGELPFLMKLLAPGQPVSLQVHPTPANARVGFAQEQARKIPLDAANRSFKDTNHKPEMVFAITDFEGLVGFRDVSEIQSLLGAYDLPVMSAIHSAFQDDNGPKGIRACLESLLRLGDEAVEAVVAEARRISTFTKGVLEGAHATVVELATHYPGDSGTIASLMLNRVALKAGDSIFVGSGTPHAYLSGLAVEIMANSDNVFRAGLTAKYVDIPGLMENIDVSSGPIHLIAGDEISPGVRVLRPSAREFQLTSITVNHTIAALESGGPRIGICVFGSLQVNTGEFEESYQLSPGDAVFLDASEGSIEVSGSGHMVVGSVP